jgi:hypothetical protein
MDGLRNQFPMGNSITAQLIRHDLSGLAITTVLSLQSSSVYSSELDAPKTDRFAAHGDTPLSEKIFNISMAEVKTIVEPDRVGNDIGRKAVAFVCVHLLILAVTAG